MRPPTGRPLAPLLRMAVPRLPGGHGPTVEDQADPAGELRGAERLLEERDAAAFGPAAQDVVRVTRYIEDPDIGPDLADAGSKLAAAHDRHHEIRQQEVDP